MLPLQWKWLDLQDPHLPNSYPHHSGIEKSFVDTRHMLASRDPAALIRGYVLAEGIVVVIANRLP